ncbi:hypothetical protein H6P81_012139 [Aristolochia fimbriata]|uniref:Uncharacterized protein n=1 Tax=Aristolochia fimbriata TaxID=158543 RepID=A0AAV7EE23_ARIFI|nr:hypothetical protein H6P81_012139 [Aristolochia fimbriata]
MGDVEGNPIILLLRAYMYEEVGVWEEMKRFFLYSLLPGINLYEMFRVSLPQSWTCHCIGNVLAESDNCREVILGHWSDSASSLPGAKCEFTT